MKIFNRIQNYNSFRPLKSVILDLINSKFALMRWNQQQQLQSHKSVVPVVCLWSGKCLIVTLQSAILNQQISPGEYANLSGSSKRENKISKQ